METTRKSIFVILDVSLFSEPNKTAFAQALRVASYSRFIPSPLGARSNYTRPVDKHASHRDHASSCYSVTIVSSEQVGYLDGVIILHYIYGATLYITASVFPCDMHRLYKAFSRTLLRHKSSVFVLG